MARGAGLGAEFGLPGQFDLPGPATAVEANSTATAPASAYAAQAICHLRRPAAGRHVLGYLARPFALAGRAG